MSHDQYIYALCRIAAGAGYQLTVFTTEDKFFNLKAILGENRPDIEWILKKKEEPLKVFLGKVKRYCDKNLDVLVADSVQVGFKNSIQYLQFNPKCKKILFVYNLNQWLDTRLSFKKSILTNYQRLIRRKILSGFDAINLEYPPLSEYASQFKYNKNIYTFAPVFFEGSHYQDKGPIRFLVPGYIEESRRDYHFLLDVFNCLFKKYSSKAELSLLGEPVGAYGAEIINRCAVLKDKGYPVKWFINNLTFEEFSRRIRQSDVILNPLRQTVRHKCGIEDIYGTTKGSGVIFDALRFGKPIILPEYFKLAGYLKTSSLRYTHGKFLKELIESLINNRTKFDNLKNAAVIAAEEFSLDKQKARLENMILELMAG